MRKNLSLLVLFIALIEFPTWSATAFEDEKTERKVEQLLQKMTLEEKLGQMNQLNPHRVISKDFVERIRRGEVGSLLNIVDTESINKLQKVAVEESRLGIPLLIARDVIHGFKTIFPIPLGQAASFKPELIKTAARVAATEATETGIRWTFAPMLDIARDARWGRIAESFGEDPYLVGVLGKAMVKGFQGDNLANTNSVAACVKHFIGYGAAEGGRDYNSTYIPTHLLKNVYLPPFHESIQAGAATLMTAFNDNDGIPCSGNSYLLKDVLRKEWNFKGMIVSDWTSVSEMIPHGFAANEKEAARIAANAGVEMEMVSETYITHLKELIMEGVVKEEVVDEAVRNILRLKFRLGLFKNPYTDLPSKTCFYASSHLEIAREIAAESAILLKNSNEILPLSRKLEIAVIGPMAHAPHDQMGTWVFDGEQEHTVTPLDALKGEFSDVSFRFEPTLICSRDTNKINFQKAIKAVSKSDVAVLFLGEESILSGEAHALSNINLMGVQSELLKTIKEKTGKPVVLVIMAGRPLTIERDLPYADAVLYNFHPGTMGGPAIWDLLFGKTNPSGNLPVTFVKETGQIPMYYNHTNTGRPAPDKVGSINEIPLGQKQSSLGNTSFYLDSGNQPLFPFGFGLSYTDFEYSELEISDDRMKAGDTIRVSIKVKNKGRMSGAETVQLYIGDKTASITRPVKELKGFKKIYLNPGEKTNVSFAITLKELSFYRHDSTWGAEPGIFNVWIGPDSEQGLRKQFSLYL